MRKAFTPMAPAIVLGGLLCLVVAISGPIGRASIYRGNTYANLGVVSASERTNDGAYSLAQPYRPPAVEDDGPVAPIKVDVDLTLVTVTVKDPAGHSVSGLQKNNFSIFEDDVPQEVSTFSVEDVLVSVGIVLDTSNSMAEALPEAKEAAVRFVQGANPGDEYFLVGFNDRAELISPFTTNINELQHRMTYMTPHGATALYDAIYLGLSEMRRAHNPRRALLVISDGGDNHSRFNERDIWEFLKESDCQLYVIGMFKPSGMWRILEERYGPILLSELAELSGGRFIPVTNTSNLRNVAAATGLELRSQYVLGYRPKKGPDGAWRRIKVTLAQRNNLAPLRAYARAGYYAPVR